MKRTLLLACAALMVIAACTHRVDIALEPDFETRIQKGGELANVTPALTFFRGDYTDKRQNPEMLATFKQGIHTYNLYEQRPMGEALFEGLGAALMASNQKWVDGKDGDVKVNVTFVNLQSARNAGFIKVGATSSIQIKVDLLDSKTGDAFYTNIYTGTDQRDQALVGLMGMVKESIDAAVVGCIQNVVNDGDLVKALGKLKR